MNFLQLLVVTALLVGAISCQTCTQNADCASGNFCNLDYNCDGSGSCQAVPEVCTAIYVPVCGCDGQTYSSACEAHGQSMSVAADGECSDTPSGDSCSTHSDCSSGEFCNQDNNCGGLGVCDTKPDLCTMIYAPVCGCDGRTYSSDCVAHGQSMSVDYQGECDGKSGSSCSANSDCSSGEFCNLDYDCSGTGSCETVPDFCTEIYDPVCGCDGETHGNDCSAHAKSVSVSSRGECSGNGSPFCSSNADCSRSEYCAFKGRCNGAGSCTARPEACTLQYDPVCGCNGKTYGNACTAASSGVSVAHRGECKGSSSGGCSSDSECGANEYCRRDYDCSGEGTCADVPTACTREYAPVCGCDGATYGNACEASSNGVSVASDGECGVPELTCAVVLCAAPECDVGDCGYYEYDDSGLACCPQCCPEECVNCLVDPCSNYFCASDPSLECQSNYCGGCNRLWFSSERSGIVQCEQEGTYSAPRGGEALAKPAADGDLPSSEYDLPLGMADDDDNSSASRLSFLVTIILVAVLIMY